MTRTVATSRNTCEGPFFQCICFPLHPAREASQVPSGFGANVFSVSPAWTACGVSECGEQRYQAKSCCNLAWRREACPVFYVGRYQQSFVVRICGTQPAQVFEQVLETEKRRTDIAFRPVEKHARRAAQQEVARVEVQMSESVGYYALVEVLERRGEVST